MDDLIEALGSERVRTDPLDLALHGRDASLERGSAAAVCFPADAAGVADAVRVAARHGRPFVARGSGTGLAGGAVPCGEPLVIVTTGLNRILEVDEVIGTAWVEPGVLNLDLTRAVGARGLYFSPDPSSQQACSIGGNVANNSGGPHCLRDGVTQVHVKALEVVLPDGALVVLGSDEPEAPGYDLRGAFIGSEGTCGIATRVLVSLLPMPDAVETLLISFDDLADAGQAVSGVLAAGVVPAAVEMLDAGITAALERFVGGGLPTDAAAVLLIECDGAAGAVAAEAEAVIEVMRAHGAKRVQRAADEAERAGWWRARKSAFGAVAGLAPAYYLHDTVVPRQRLAEVLGAVVTAAERHRLQVVNVFHAGDGNLHPLLLFDPREPGIDARVHAAGEEIVRISLEAGGVLSGEHGVGLEKRDFMTLQFDEASLDAQRWLREVFDPDGRANPAKVLPSPASCGDVMQLGSLPEGTWV